MNRTAVITGSRDHTPTSGEFLKLRKLLFRHRIDNLWHGGCRGVDTAVAEYVRTHIPKIKVTEFPAPWSLHGKKAGPIRNSDMLNGQQWFLHNGKWNLDEATMYPLPSLGIVFMTNAGRGTMGCRELMWKRNLEFVDL